MWLHHFTIVILCGSQAAVALVPHSFALCRLAGLLWWCSSGAYSIFALRLALALQCPFDLPCSGCGELDMPVLLCLLDGVSHALVPLRDHTHVCALDHLQEGCTTNMGTGCFVLVYMFGALMVTLVSTFFPSARYLGWSLMCVVGSSKSLYDIVHILLQLPANQLYYDARPPEFSCACRHFDSSGYRGWSLKYVV